MLKRELLIAIYRLITLLFLPFAVILLGVRMVFGKEDNSRVIERFGFSFKMPELGIKYIWIHAASIGEMNVAVELIKSLQKNKNIPRGYSFLLTTQTLSSSKVFKSHLQNGDISNCVHHFLPYDISFIADKFLHSWSPVLAIFIESEIWPLYLNVIRCPILLLNARISDSSIAKWRKIKWLARYVFGNFDEICAASIEDQKRYSKFRTAAKFYGNIKLCSSPLKYKEVLYKNFSKFYSKFKKPVITLASTSAEEIDGIIFLIEVLFEKCNFIIVPRHSKDCKIIAAKLKKLNLEYRLRSEHSSPFAPVYIADTYNELGLFFNISDLVFLGGSMCNRGGQNMLEPIRVGIPTIVGPNTNNFTDIMNELKRYGAIIEVNDFTQLKSAVDNLIKEGSFSRKKLLSCIKNFNNSNSQILTEYTNLVIKYLKE